MEFERELNLPPVERWEHEPNPLVGELINRYTFEGEFEPAEMLIVLPDGSEIAYSVLCGKATLRSFVEQKDPQIGGMVGIKFVGEAVSHQNGKPYPLYNGAYRAAQAAGEPAGKLVPGAAENEPDSRADDDEVPF